MKKENWIKVEDVLPKDDSVVLVYDSQQGVLVAAGCSDAEEYNPIYIFDESRV